MLGQVDPSTAHLAANLHGNLARHYQNQHKPDLARVHMEQAIYLLENYPHQGEHDLIILYSNYSVLLTDLGEPQKGYQVLEKVSQLVREGISDQCLDYADVQQRMAFLALILGDRKKAEVHFRKCIEIYSVAYGDSPNKLLEIQNNIRKAMGYLPLPV